MFGAGVGGSYSIGDNMQFWTFLNMLSWSSDSLWQRDEATTFESLQHIANACFNVELNKATCCKRHIIEHAVLLVRRSRAVGASGARDYMLCHIDTSICIIVVLLSLSQLSSLSLSSLSSLLSLLS